MEPISFKCTSCSAPLQFIPGSERTYCNYCGMSYIIADNKSTSNSNVPNVGTNIVKSSIPTQTYYVPIEKKAIRIKLPIINDELCPFGASSWTKGYGFPISYPENIDDFKDAIQNGAMAVSIISELTNLEFTIDFGCIDLYWNYKVFPNNLLREWRIMRGEDLLPIYPQGFVDYPLEQNIWERELERVIWNECVCKEPDIQQIIKSFDITVNTVGLIKKHLKYHPSSGNIKSLTGKYGIWSCFNCLLTLTVSPDKARKYVEPNVYQKALKISSFNYAEKVSRAIVAHLMKHYDKNIASIKVETVCVKVECGRLQPKTEYFYYNDYGMETIHSDETKLLLLSVLLGKVFNNGNSRITEKWMLTKIAKSKNIDHNWYYYTADLQALFEKHVKELYTPWT